MVSQYARHDLKRIEFPFIPEFVEFDKRINFGQASCRSATVSDYINNLIFRVIPVTSVFFPLIIIRAGKSIYLNLVHEYP